MNPSTAIVVPFDSGNASLSLVGGKARSLARLVVAGFPVPAGFILSTVAYQQFVQANELQESILGNVASYQTQQSASPPISDDIQALFEAATLPKDIAMAIAQAYAALGDAEPAVAVRSSATAEDLPDLSFAGQHDSYLNVRGEAALIKAIRDCWASLWSTRAIGYRERMSIDQRGVAMGVVVQVMVPAEVSGILFTANPANGSRSQLVINSSFGLGEAIVGGHVTPDNYLVDRVTLELTESVTGGKEAMVVTGDSQGIKKIPVPSEKRGKSSLTAESLKQLAALSLRVEQLFDGMPQDIEWAVAEGTCWLLQARPITNLPPAPLDNVTWDPPTKGGKLIRRQVVENMPEPLSPLFEELYLQVGLEQAIDQFMRDFGMNFDASVFLERPMFVTVNGYAYCRGSYRLSWRLLWVMPRILYAYIRVVPKLLRNMISDWREHDLPAYSETIQQWKSVDPATANDEQLVAGLRSLAIGDANYWLKVAVILGAAKITDGLLNRFVTSRWVPGDLTSGVFLRGFPSKTLEAQEALETIARTIHQDESLRTAVLSTSAASLLDILKLEHGGHQVVEDIHYYLQQYGHQIYNLDFVQPTQLEDPRPVLLGLKSLVQNEGYDTPSRQLKLVRERDLQIQATLESLGPLRRWLFRKLLGWAQTYGPYREQGLFYMGAAWPTLRSLALELGDRLVKVGGLIERDDVFFLESSELLGGCSGGPERPSGADVAQRARRRRDLREARKQLHPPGMVPERSKFKFGPFDFSAFETQKRNADDTNALKGFAVSPGKVTGPASVILSPADFEQMKPDTILVCPTTTPAWTPLFSQASGLATDIGGILAHGSIVAREYGIPAVMGTGNVTRRIVSGQRITVDGDRGIVTIVE